MKRATTTTNNSKAKNLTKNADQKKANTRHDLHITWTATEPGPHKRWWWFVGFCIVMVWLIALLTLLQDWSLLALAVAAALAILVTYTQAPRQLVYRLDTQKLAVNKQNLQLEDYRAFTVETARVGVDDTQPVIVILLPKRRFGLPAQIALPANVDETTKVLNAFREVLPFNEAKGYLASLRFLDRFAHWLRLN